MNTLTDAGMHLSDDSALNNLQMHQRLRQLLALSQMLQQSQPQQHPLTLGLNPAQYPSLQIQTPHASGGINPMMLMYLAQMQQPNALTALSTSPNMLLGNNV